MKTAVIYARYSSDSQSEQSIEGQLRVCQQYAKNNDILILDTYIDRAMTGTNDARPGFQKMLQDSSKKQWDYVIVYKLDRFSRDKYEATIHKHTLRENGVKLLSAMENIPDTPEGIILESLLEGMNQYYSAELSQKIRRGQKESYIKGQYTGGPILFGYDIVDKKYVINPTETEIVREIFSKFSIGITGKSIAQELMVRGIRTKKGHYVDAAMIYKIIQTIKYTGKAIYGNEIYTNIYPAIIDEDTWNKVQLIRNENKHLPGRKKEMFDFILSGKLVCGHCKNMIIGESGTSQTGEKYYYYTCFSRRKKRAKCNFHSINKQRIEDFVIKTTWNLLNDKESIEEIVKQLCALHEKNSKEQVIIKSLTAKRNDALKASNNLIAAIEQGIITEQTKIRLKELEAQIAQYDFDIEQEKQRNYTYLTPEMIREYLKSIICGDINDIKIRKEIVRLFIREIIYDNKEISIVYNFTDNIKLTNKNIPDNIKEVIEQSEMAANNFRFSSNKQDGASPYST